MFGVIMPLCNRMFCCIFGCYFYIEIRLKYEKIFCCPALELFHCLPLWKTLLFVRSRAFSLSTPTLLLSTPVENSEATWKKAAKCNKELVVSCTELVIQRTIKLSHFGLIDARVSASYKDLPVLQQFISFEAMNYVFTITLQYKSSLATRKKLPSLINHRNSLTSLHFLYCNMNYCSFIPPPTKKQ